MNARATENLIKYGISSDLAQKAISLGLTKTKIQSLSLKNLTTQFGLQTEEAEYVKKAVLRAPIDDEVIHSLLERSNYLCCVCKGEKGHSYIIHHIVEYERTQDNDRSNLAVLCPNDHDLAHQGGLTLRLTPKQILKSKSNWEALVERENVQRAAQKIDVKDDAIDHVNINRIEELCIRIFKKIPRTELSAKLMSAGILRPDGSFDQAYVKNHVSNGRFLFDYITHQETEHYKQLLQKISKKIDFIDLDLALSNPEMLLDAQGKYAFFIGGVSAKGPEFPITDKTPPIKLKYSRKPVKVTWVLDPHFMMSTSAICRIGGVNRYIIYCLIRSVIVESKKSIRVKASSLLIAQPRLCMKSFEIPPTPQPA